jgi:hypothetical protein
MASEGPDTPFKLSPAKKGRSESIADSSVSDFAHSGDGRFQNIEAEIEA